VSTDDVADPFGRVVLRVQGGGPLGELAQLAMELLEHPDARAEGGDLADLAEGEAERLGGADEPEPGKGRLVVGAVAGGGAGRRVRMPSCSS
jgi:hypothetical protein